MSIIKSIGKLFLIICVLTTMFLPITAQAANKYLVTILLIPDKSFEYTDYDSAYVTIVNNHTGQSYHYTVYPYNNFSDKVWLEEGTYSVLDVGMQGRSDMIFESSSEDIVVDRATAIVVNFGDSKIIKQNVTTTTKVTTTVATTTGTTKPESPTLFPIISGKNSTSSSDITENTTALTKPTTTLKETTTENSKENIAEQHPILLPAIILTVIVAIICAVFFIVLYKKNKAEK